MVHELIGDDRVVPDFFLIENHAQFVPFGLPFNRQKSEESVGYHVIPVIEDLEDDFSKLQKSTWTFGTKEADAWKAQVEDVFGDILPVQVQTPPPYAVLTQWLLRYMSMETMMFSIYDYPELVHEMMDRLSNDYLEFLMDLEKNGMLTVNNNNLWLGQGTWAFTHELSAEPGKVTLKDTWGFMDSQETVAISPDMFAEFFFPYYRRIGEKFGRLNYGCCEPVDPVWENCVSKLENLCKVSVSPVGQRGENGRIFTWRQRGLPPQTQPQLYRGGRRVRRRRLQSPHLKNPSGGQRVPAGVFLPGYLHAQGRPGSAPPGDGDHP